MNPTDSYSTAEAAHLAGATTRNAEYWATIGVATAFIPSNGTGSDRKYNYADVIVLAAMQELQGTSVELRKQVAYKLRRSDLSAEIFSVRISPILEVFLNLKKIRAAILRRLSEKSVK